MLYNGDMKLGLEWESCLLNVLLINYVDMSQRKWKVDGNV